VKMSFPATDFDSISPADRPAKMREALAEQRRIARTGLDTDAARARNNVETLEALIKNAEAMNVHAAEVVAGRERRAAEAEAKKDAALRVQLRPQYPTLSDAEYAERWPNIRANHDAGRLEQAVAAVKASGRYSL